MKKMNKKGFTLAELLIVVAIIGVLTAIAIPVFTSQLERSREATDISNIRSYYAEVTTGLLTGDLKTTGNAITVGKDITATMKNDLPVAKDGTFDVELSPVNFSQKVADWQTKGYDIAGVTSMTAWASTYSKVTFTFTLAADADYYLSAITLS